MKSKYDIRADIKLKKQLFDNDWRISMSDRILSTLETLPVFISAKSIALYHSLPDEVYTHSFIDKWANNKRIYIPKVYGDSMKFLPYSNSIGLVKGSFGIFEPNFDCNEPHDIDLIIVPAVALSPSGNRIGRGKGYYDKWLSKNSHIKKVAIVFDFQICDEFECDDYDIPMDIVITENRIFKLTE